MDLKCHKIKMTLAVHEIGRINQRANVEGVHDGEEERVSLSSGLPEIRKQHVTHLATFMPVGSTQAAQWTISWHPNLPKLVWSFSLSLFFLLDMWISLCGSDTMVEPRLSLALNGNNHNLLLYTISCLIFASYL